LSEINKKINEIINCSSPWKILEALVFSGTANGFDFDGKDPKQLINTYKTYREYNITPDNRLDNSLSMFKDTGGFTIIYNFQLKDRDIKIKRYENFPADNMKDDVENTIKYLEDKIKNETDPNRKFELENMCEKLKCCHIKKIGNCTRDKELKEILELAVDYLKYSP